MNIIIGLIHVVFIYIIQCLQIYVLTHRKTANSGFLAWQFLLTPKHCHVLLFKNSMFITVNLKVVKIADLWGKVSKFQNYTEHYFMILTLLTSWIFLILMHNVAWCCSSTHNRWRWTWTRCHRWWRTPLTSSSPSSSSAHRSTFTLLTRLMLAQVVVSMLFIKKI